MRAKTIIDNSPEVRRLKNWIRGMKECGYNTNPPVLKEVIMEYSIEDLIARNLPIFQRTLQSSRLIKIASKVFEFGFLFFPIILDELYRMVDGQHRVVVAYILGYESIPVVVYTFKNNQHKSDVFTKICMPEGGGPAIKDRLSSRKIAGYPYESMMYKLSMVDTGSKFYNIVGWKGVSKSTTQITLPVFMKIFNWIGLGIRRKWDSGYDGALQHTCQEMTTQQYNQVRDRLNLFADWFFAWAGSSAGKPDVFKEKILIGFMDFYLMMIEQSPSACVLTRHKRESIRRFAPYNMANLLPLDFTGVVSNIIKQYNTGRQIQNRIKDTDMEIRVPHVWGDMTI